jgi:hypothetical protein
VADDLKNANSKVQESLENAILKYQKSLLTNNKSMIDRSYKEVCKIYPPMLHMQEWYGQYHYLYDSQEDFHIEYIKIFCNVLSNWKPRSKRKVSRYNGSGEFKNYFIGALQHNYINLVKKDNAAKRNPEQKCPICEQWVNPLSTHLLKSHRHILWNFLKQQNYNFIKLIKCPFCKKHKMPRSYECLEKCKKQKPGGCHTCKLKQRIQIIKKHLVSHHSTMLFNRFNELHPHHQTVSPRALSVYMPETNDDDENCYYDQIKDNSRIGDILQIEMSDLENQIIEKALSSPIKGKYINLEFDAKLYNCSMEEFSNALENIKNKMSMIGMEG